MNYKEVMDLWFVWIPIMIIVFKYIKGVMDTWNED